MIYGPVDYGTFSYWTPHDRHLNEISPKVMFLILRKSGMNISGRRRRQKSLCFARAGFRSRHGTEELYPGWPVLHSLTLNYVSAVFPTEHSLYVILSLSLSSLGANGSQPEEQDDNYLFPTTSILQNCPDPSSWVFPCFDNTNRNAERGHIFYRRQ